MRYNILGPLELRSDERSLEVAGAKRRAVLAMLLLNANHVVSNDRLIEALWEERAPDTAPKVLQVHISQLRKLLGSERLATRSPGYVLRVEEGELDLHEYETLLRQARSAPPVDAARLLGDALALWRGPPLADFALDRFAQAEIARLDEIHFEAVADRIEAELALGAHRALVGTLEALVGEHPLRERLRGQLMLALYRSGRQAEALERYQEGRTALVEGLGIEPGHALRELHQAILRQDRGLDPPAPTGPTVEPTGSAFVGRTSELGQLLSGLESAIAGEGRIFLIAGEPGIGKSRLAEELIALARARGARILVGRCWEAGGAPAYWPWVQSLRSYIRETDRAALRAQLGAGAGELAHILPELRQILPGLPEPVSLESESARFRLFDATAEFLRGAARSQPIVLVLDDLHAADASSLLLLQFLARELGASRLLVLGAYRDLDPIPGLTLTATLTEISREPVARRLTLGGLSRSDVADYLELTASEISSPELVATLHEGTEGNPLFVGETVRLLALERAKPQSPRVGIAIPQTVRDVISRRLTHFSDECIRVLVVASALGREFAISTLAHVSGLPENDLLEALDDAQVARVVSDVPGADGRLRFAHVLIRDTLYEGLTSARRVRLHRMTVAALEALPADELPSHLAELAHHSMAGSDFARALLYARRAGDRALALLAFEEAARLYESALAALERSSPADEQLRCKLLLELGEAEARAGDAAAAKRAFLAAAEVAGQLGATRELALAAYGYGGRSMYGRAGDDDLLVPLLEDALVRLAEDDLALRARLLARLAGALRDEPSRDRRDRLSREAIEIARSTGDLTALAYALDGRAAAMMAPDTVAECLALGAELCEVAARIGDSERITHGHLHRLIAQIMVGDLDGAAADLDAMDRLADQLRQPAELWQVAAAEAMLGLAAGQLSDAEERIALAFTLGERSELFAIPVYRLQRYTLYDFLGRLEELEPQMRDLVAEYPARTAFRCALAHLSARLGRTDEASRSLADLAAGDFAAVPFDNEWLFALSLLAETCALVGDVAAAPALHGLLLPWAEFNVLDHPEAIRGSVARYLGLVAATAERSDDAAVHFETAIEMNERMGARPWLAHTQADYARMLLARDAPGDRARAHELLRDALAIYSELGMQTYASSTAGLLREH